jgi:hypothetical protein
VLYEYVKSGQQLEESSAAKRVEHKPFFVLVGNSTTGDTLDLQIQNEGSPVNCLDFHSATSACNVRTWYPRSLPAGATLRATVDLAPARDECVFRMLVRDRSDAERTFEIKLDLRRNPPFFDVLEIY